jgi:hypothetical protein
LFQTHQLPLPTKTYQHQQQQKLKKNGNFASFFAVGAGLNIHSVSRLKAMWEDLPQKYQQAFDDMMVRPQDVAARVSVCHKHLVLNILALWCTHECIALCRRC